MWLGLLCLVSSCDSALSQDHQHLGQSTTLNPQLSRFTLTNLDRYPVKDWKVSAVGIYGLTSELTKQNTVTTSSRANCGGGPNSYTLFSCKRTYAKALERNLPKQSISINEAGQLLIDVPFEEQEGKSTYFMREVYVSVTKCADCIKESFNIELRCYQSDIAPEILQNKLIMQLRHGDKVSAKTKQCGLGNQTYTGRFTRETALKVIKGHFSEDDLIPSYELLNTFFAIPTKQGGWMPNRSHVGETMGDYCPTNNGYDRSELTPNLDQKMGWPYLPKVEMFIYRMATDNTLCEIVIDGTAQVGELRPSVRYTYIFKQGQLALMKTEEADDTERWLRFEDGKPFEYLRKHDPDSIAGGEDVVYWHRDAAKEWPERMDFTPDWNEFTQALSYAKALETQYVSPLPAVNAK
jgi:hypothetical protein